MRGAFDWLLSPNIYNLSPGSRTSPSQQTFIYNEPFITILIDTCNSSSMTKSPKISLSLSLSLSV